MQLYDALGKRKTDKEELDENHTAVLYDKAKDEKLTFRPLNDVLKEVQAKRSKRRVSGSDQ